MKLKALFKASGILLLSILLTTVCSFAETGRASREAYVKSAFEQFHSLIFFLSGNDRFLQNLTPQERAQFDLVGNYLVKHVVRYGPAVTPEQDRTSRHVDFALRFSDRNEDFILNPNEPPRTAKMAGDIWFNLNVINNPKVSFGLLDAFQILFHEFGHKIGEKKDQVLIDSVAAKIRQELASYHRETSLDATTKVSSVIIPYLAYDRHAVDFQFEPIVIIERQSQTAVADFKINEVLFSGIGYLENPSRAQAYSRVILNPKYMLVDGGLRIEWQVSIRHSFVVSPKYNYQNLFTNLAKAKIDEKLEPVMEYKRLIHTVNSNQLQQIADGEFKNQNLNLLAINHDYLPYTPGNEKSRWISNLKYQHTANGRVYYSAVIESLNPVTSIRLLGTHNDFFYKFKGDVRSVGNQIYELTFSLPAESSVEGTMRFDGIVLNDQERWDLPEVAKMPLRQTQTPRSLSPAMIGIKDESGNIVRVDQVTTPGMPTDQIVWRFGYRDPSVQIEQIEIMWLIPENVEKDGVHYGVRVRNLHEVIDAKDIRQSVIDGFRIVEFTSAMASKVIANTKTSEGYTTKDTLTRYMRQLQITDINYNTYATRPLSLRNGWKSSFELIPKKDNFNAQMCESLF